jgi:hypothetical protein
MDARVESENNNEAKPNPATQNMNQYRSNPAGKISTLIKYIGPRGVCNQAGVSDTKYDGYVSKRGIVAEKKKRREKLKKSRDAETNKAGELVKSHKCDPGQ